MTIDIDHNSGHPFVRISEELTIYTAGQLKETLLARPGESGPCHLDLSRVTEIDSAGLQVLLAALRPAADGKPAGILDACSPAVRDCLELCGLDLLLPDTASTLSGEH